MKKILIPAIALCGALAITSCSSDEPMTGGTGNDAVSFRIEVPASLATRATFGDESMVSLNNLQWSVYDMSDKANPKLVFSNADKSAFQSSQKYETVNLQLVKGVAYQVAFFADNEQNKFVTCTDGVLTVDYAAAKSNTANEDAFVGTSGIFTVGADGYSETVTLKRPFAQLNWGTDDLNAESVQPLLASLTANVTVESPLYTTYSILGGTYGGATTGNIQFPGIAMNNLPSETFPKVHDFKTYDLIAMNYLLTNKQTINLTLAFSNGTEVPVANAPVNTNFRTNIYGSLLTAPGSFNIVVDSSFDTPDNNIVVTTTEEFVSGIKEGANVTVEEGTVINLANEGPIELSNNQVLTVNGVLQTTRQQIGVSGAGNSATVQGTGTIVAVGSNGNRPLNVYDGATLTVKGVTVNSTQNNGGSTIYSDNGHLILEDMSSLDNHNFAVAANGGSLTATNCTINSDSNNKQGAWSYTMDIAAGCEAVLTNVNVNGIQGGISITGKGTKCTIVSGTYATKLFNGTAGTAFYPVYVHNKAVVIIEGGEFISEGPYTVFDGDNDINEPFADQIMIRGGKYNKATYSQRTRQAIPADEGYEWKSINQSPFTLEVVKKP